MDSFGLDGASEYDEPLQWAGNSSAVCMLVIGQPVDLQVTGADRRHPPVRLLGLWTQQPMVGPTIPAFPAGVNFAGRPV